MDSLLETDGEKQELGTTSVRLANALNVMESDILVEIAITPKGVESV